MTAAGSAAPGERPAQGLVVRSYSNVCQIRIETGDERESGDELEAALRGRLRQEALRPLTGDRVRLRLYPDGTAVVEEVLPRTTLLERPPVANVEQALVVVTPDDPPVPLALVDRILVQVERAGLDAALAWNKADLPIYEREAERIGAEQALYTGAGYRVFTASARRGDGLAPIRRWLQARISVLAGPSGVGKSSLVNALHPAWERRTGPVGSQRRRGRHVTRGVTLLPLKDGGWVADSPGFSRLNVDGILGVELSMYFREFRPHMEACRFAECVHDQEPGCGVKEAVARDEIARERYARYLELLDETRRWEAARYD